MLSDDIADYSPNKTIIKGIYDAHYLHHTENIGVFDLARDICQLYF